MRQGGSVMCGLVEGVRFVLKRQSLIKARGWWVGRREVHDFGTEDRYDVGGTRLTYNL